mgnify:CR=1 FL=1
MARRLGRLVFGEFNLFSEGEALQAFVKLQVVVPETMRFRPRTEARKKVAEYKSLADIANSSIAPALVESCPTRIFLPNERAQEPQSKETYERFGLNTRQIELISRATPKRDYYYQSPLGARVFDLGLGPIALSICGASSPEDQARMDRIWATRVFSFR